MPAQNPTPEIVRQDTQRYNTGMDNSRSLKQSKEEKMDKTDTGDILTNINCPALTISPREEAKGKDEKHLA